MKLFPWFRRSPKTVQASSFEAAQMPARELGWYARADNRGPITSLPYGERTEVKKKCRYEFWNNSYVAGIVNTLALDVVGTGPRLQITGGDPEANLFIEREFSRWALAIDLAGKLRQARISKAVDGEVLPILTIDDALPTVCHTNLIVYESDFLREDQYPTHPAITYGNNGEPVSFYMWNQHPGDLQQVSGLSAADIPASRVLYYAHKTRPGQERGQSELAPCILLFGKLRRYTEATLAAAENAAYHAIALKTQQAPQEVLPVAPGDTLNMRPGSIPALPAGYELDGIDATQPATTYEMFKAEIINEAARCFCMPYNVAAGNSSSYNFASGRMDHLKYNIAIETERQLAERCIVNRLLHAWLAEAQTIADYLPVMTDDTQFEWVWPNREPQDQKAEAEANKTMLESNQTNLKEVWAAKGKDWEVQLRQIAAEKKLMKELGVEQQEAAPQSPNIKQETNDAGTN